MAEQEGNCIHRLSLGSVDIDSYRNQTVVFRHLEKSRRANSEREVTIRVEYDTEERREIAQHTLLRLNQAHQNPLQSLSLLSSSSSVAPLPSFFHLSSRVTPFASAVFLTVNLQVSFHPVPSLEAPLAPPDLLLLLPGFSESRISGKVSRSTEGGSCFILTSAEWIA